MAREDFVLDTYNVNVEKMWNVFNVQCLVELVSTDKQKIILGILFSKTSWMVKLGCTWYDKCNLFSFFRWPMFNGGW